MSRRAWILVILLIGVILLAILAGTGFYYIFRKPIEVRKGSVVEIVLQGSVQELPSANPLHQVFGSGLNLWELGRALQVAAKDDRVTGVYLEIHPLLLRWGQVEELRDYLHQFQRSGKPIHALLAVDLLEEDELYLASAADSITLNPDAGLLVNGLRAEVTFFKKTLEKLGIQPDFLQFKEYKSPELYTRRKLSPEIRGMLESILEDIQKRFVTTVVRERNMEEARLQELITRGMASAPVALEEGLVDALGYKDQLEQKFMSSSEGDKKYRPLSVSRYLKAVKGKLRSRAKHQVALIGGVGSIMAGESDPLEQTMGGTTMASHLRDIRKDERIKGVIFRVDSPGGSAVGSDVVWREITLLEKANKPVVVSMSGVAGSGGYYISMGARRIISQPSTLTGSIGVIFGKFNVRGLYDWLGMSVDQVKLSPNADIFSAFTSLTPEQKKQVESWMSTIYERFVRKAAEGRNMTYEQFEPKAHGRIYTGAQAKALGLVDDLGGLQVAVEQVKQALQLEEKDEIELVLFPKPKSFWELLRSGEFLGVNQSSSLAEWLEREVRVLGTPAPWLLMPEIRIY